MPPAGTFLGTGGQEHLAVGVRKDDRAHVAAVGHQPRRDPERPLPLLKRGPDLGDGGDRRGQGTGGLQPQLVGGIGTVDQHPQSAIAVLEADVGVEGAAHQRRRVGQVQVGPAGRHPDRPVQRPRIQVVPAQARGDQAADGTLAGTGRAVDGKDRDGGGHGDSGAGCGGWGGRL